MLYRHYLLCETCQKRKQVKNSFSNKNIISTSRPLEMLHLYLFGPTRMALVSGKRYGLVIVYDYSRWIWVMFLTHKDESFSVFLNFVKWFKMKKVYALLQPEVTMKENLKMSIFNCFVKKTLFFPTCQFQEHLDKMVRLRGRTYYYRKQQGPCLMIILLISTFGIKQ